MKKPNFFGSREAFDAAAAHDGFLLEGEAGNFTLHGRIAGQAYRLEAIGGSGDYRFHDGTVTLDVENGKAVRLAESTAQPQQPHRVDMGRFHTLAALLVGITDRTRVHQVNARLLAAAD